ncbi:Na+/H+ antiporter NhaC family protein [Pseudogracilibacillus sp. ICA-222130]|uniref:Na+/H+ antiporter NhaC family protein n=1 Tax=Pseudogracilibacillus sp. ICA-222130 TaxID=3134655 RepID=UPI0030C33D47
MSDSILSIIPPLIAILMVLITKRVLLSLGVGILFAAFFVANYQIGETLSLIIQAFVRVFVEDGGLNTWNIYIILFLFLLGIITSFVSMMGGTRAFGDWMILRVKTRVGAQIMTIVLGFALFIDDYFNSLTVGQVARPVTDKHRISRAKLAYIVDSTAAPICVIAPLSSWGAYILGLIGTVFMTHNIVDYSALSAFITMIPMNYYVWSAIGLVFILAIRQADFGAMKKHELHALETGDVTFQQQKTETQQQEEKSSAIGKISDLLIPIIMLFIGTIGLIFTTGYIALAPGERSIINILGEADVSLSLFLGGLIAVFITFFMSIRHIKANQLEKKDFSIGIFNGLKAMLSAVIILIFAWAITDLIDQLGTGTYLANIVKQSNIPFAILPFIIFIMAGIIAFSTGTSWGAFALLLPIAGQIAASTNIDLILPMLAAVLAGAVFGDHCSPISDTTILSSTGSSCNHIDHVMTQLPYAIVAAVIAGLGYVVLGFTENVYFGLITVIIGLFIVYLLLGKTKLMPNNDR